MANTLGRDKVQLNAYAHVSIKERMEKVMAKRPDWTLSRQLTEGIERILPELEERVGIRRNGR